jgi:sulfur relay (sulfurtransferase) DsrF/TusC family protein
MWTSTTSTPYMVLTAHWIDNDWILQNVIISFQRLSHPHTGEQIKNALFTILQDFSIITKAKTITIDNGANQVLAMDKFSNMLMEDYSIEFEVIRCGAHTISLVVNAGLYKIKSVIDKIHSFIVDIKKSSKKEEELCLLAKNLQVTYKKLILDCKTRWNSTYSMLEAFLANKPIIIAICSVQENYKKLLQLNDEEWDQLKEFCDFLKPFYEFTKAISGSKYPTLGTFIILLDALIEHLSVTISSVRSPQWIKEISKKMNDKFITVSSNLYNDATILALVLDPRYKTEYYPNDINISTIKSILKNKYLEYKQLQLNDEYKNSEENNSLTEKERIISTNSFINQVFKKKRTMSLQSNDELNEYLSITVEPLDIDPIEWWKNHKIQYPILQKIAKDYLCIPATSVPSEQAFSKSGELISKKRNRLGDKAIEGCMCLNSWLKLFNK